LALGGKHVLERLGEIADLIAARFESRVGTPGLAD
jgi:hypothetical protein